MGRHGALQTPKDPSTPDKPEDRIPANIPNDNTDSAGVQLFLQSIQLLATLTRQLMHQNWQQQRDHYGRMNRGIKNSPHPMIMEDASNTNNIESDASLNDNGDDDVMN